MECPWLSAWCCKLRKNLNVASSLSNCSAPVAFITAFVTLFALVIAVTKDLPDVEGDRS